MGREGWYAEREGWETEREPEEVLRSRKKGEREEGREWRQG